MNLMTIFLAAKKAKATADGVFAVVSLFAVPALAVTPIVWYFEGPGSLHSRASAYKAKAGSAAQISSEFEFSSKPLRVSYQLELVDHQGLVAFKYPRAASNGIPQLDNLLIQVPSNLQPGDYSLIARVKYTVNPIKSNDQTVQVASITVD